MYCLLADWSLFPQFISNHRETVGNFFFGGSRYLLIRSLSFVGLTVHFSFAERSIFAFIGYPAQEKTQSLWVLPLVTFELEQTFLTCNLPFSELLGPSETARKCFCVRAFLEAEGP